MIIRVLLLAVLGGIGYYALRRRRRVPVHIVLVLLMLGLAALFVVVPDLTNRIAHLVGVGRGVDLIGYLVQISLLFVALHYYTKFVDLEACLTRLARELTLLRAELEDERGGPPAGAVRWSQSELYRIAAATEEDAS